MKLAVTIDVEEEGLFSNKYTRNPSSAHNVQELRTLDPLFSELGIRPTLFVSYQAALSEEHRNLIAELAERWKGEIAPHLHTWNTPPLGRLPNKEPVSSELMPADLLYAKLESLLKLLEDILPVPASFRMGRFNMGPTMFSVLEGTGIKVDSSIAPMRRAYAGPDHLGAPTDPFFPDPSDPTVPGTSSILEVPLTITPIIPGLQGFLAGTIGHKWLPSPLTSWLAKDLFSMPAQPMYVGIRRLKTAALLHRRRGGSVVTTYFHSSELMPGGTPAHPTKRHVERFMKRLESFLAWLRNEMNSESLTLSELYDVHR